MFVETPDGSARDVVRVVLAGQNDVEANLDIEPTARTSEFDTIEFETLVRMKLNSFRDKDRDHLRDMISLDMADASWLNKFTAELPARLKELLDDPDG